MPFVVERDVHRRAVFGGGTAPDAVTAFGQSRHLAVAVAQQAVARLRLGERVRSGSYTLWSCAPWGDVALLNGVGWLRHWRGGGATRWLMHRRGRGRGPPGRGGRGGR